MNQIKVIRNIMCVILCVIMLLSMVACQPKAVDLTETDMFKAGTYTSTAKGHSGDIKVEVVVDENSIKDVKILEHIESPSISDPAIERIPKAIVDGQTLAVDTISGATVTSKAIIVAVTEALKQAGGDIDLLSVKKENTKTLGETVEYTTDVIVIGGGGAGLAAAVSAHQNGAAVMVVEKMPRLGGNTIISGSAYNAVDPKRQSAQGIEDSIEKHIKQTYEGGDKQGNLALIETLVENAYPAIEWLESLGMEFKEDIFTVLGGLWPRAHKPVKPLGTGFISTYENYINENEGVTVLLDTEITELIVDNNRVVGVKGKGLEGEVIINANNGVIIATGGFGANIAMRDQYNTNWPSLTNIKTTNHPGATGDGLTLAEKIGASLVGLENIQLLPMGDPETGSLSGNIEQGVENRIFVNKDGNRFVDEGERRDVMTKALMEQKDAAMWVIVDKNSYPTGETKNNFNESIDELVSQNRAFKADTLEDLAKQIGVNPDNFVKAVKEFNEAVDGTPDKFGRTLFDKKIDTAPFYAGARVPTVHHTMGGIEINTSAQVLDKDGNIIHGLYAAGEVTGGIHGANRLGGNALADITVYGKIAGESAAAKK
ncbi:flavocytochrome c [Alkaliphilus oremlandii]|uniref:Urocanate reductase n=1 Tax=Alkaliphilus oremlandii (strain OhILAs) TaxID=350688 RepID=A8MK89_ALKOO|nr:flavocytochrome c [Alkaliphilus oremlandii]ABW20221.1 flavocytochrome c [Alkaliphilus oremlandii OhILAs]